MYVYVATLSSVRRGAWRQPALQRGEHAYAHVAARVAGSEARGAPGAKLVAGGRAAELARQIGAHAWTVLTHERKVVGLRGGGAALHRAATAGARGEARPRAH